MESDTLFVVVTKWSVFLMEGLGSNTVLEGQKLLVSTVLNALGFWFLGVCVFFNPKKGAWALRGVACGVWKAVKPRRASMWAWHPASCCSDPQQSRTSPSPALVPSRDSWAQPAVASCVCKRQRYRRLPDSNTASFHHKTGRNSHCFWVLNCASLYGSISVRYSVILIHVFFRQLSLEDLGFVQQAGHAALVPLPRPAFSAAPLLDLQRGSVHIFTVWEAFQLLIFMNLKIISCGVECKCTVIHSVYIKNTRKLHFCYLDI